MAGFHVSDGFFRCDPFGTVPFVHHHVLSLASLFNMKLESFGPGYTMESSSPAHWMCGITLKNGRHFFKYFLSL
jgi:hypothetical protein